MYQSTGCRTGIYRACVRRSQFKGLNEFWPCCSRAGRHRDYNNYDRDKEHDGTAREREREIGVRYRAKCRVSGCSLRITECSSHIRSIQAHSRSRRSQWRRRSPWQGVGTPLQTRARTHSLPFPLSARPRAGGVCVCVCTTHIVPRSLLRELLATNRSIHVRNVIQWARVVARKRVSTKIPAFSRGRD